MSNETTTDEITQVVTVEFVIRAPTLAAAADIVERILDEHLDDEVGEYSMDA